ncbi:PfkB family carbohydrate kinase, partial [Arthrobacter sp. H14]|uniref:PfkB family carbohydrate kinase n=1 Tax=Arthrobacter sp. H14 TaxID=1312959 RepID=UPI00156386EF
GGDSLARHDLDRLYGITLKAGIEAGTVILSGAAGEHVVTADVYRRLASDLNTVGCRVIADLSGDRLSAALAGGLTVVKVADDELESGGRVKSTDTDELINAMHQLASEGAANVVVTRAEEPSLLLADGKVSEIHMPSLEVVDHHGAGDSLTAGVAATLADGGSITDAVTLGAAAGALNVTRHGLGSGDAEAVQKLRELVEIKPVKPNGGQNEK